MDLRKEKKFTTTVEYISFLPEKAASRMEEMRAILRKAAPEAVEVISYNMPALKLQGILVYYAAHTSHLGFYPARAEIISIFENELKQYKTSKGTIQFPMDRKIPGMLVRKIVMLRVKQNLEKAKTKKKK